MLNENSKKQDKYVNRKASLRVRGLSLSKETQRNYSPRDLVGGRIWWLGHRERETLFPCYTRLNLFNLLTLSVRKEVIDFRRVLVHKPMMKA